VSKNCTNLPAATGGCSGRNPVSQQ